MKRLFSAIVMLAALGTSVQVSAQGYDDIYYDSDNATTTTVTVQPRVKKATVVVVPSQYVTVANDNYRAVRDVDEYNRRGAQYEYYAATDTTDSVAADVDLFGNTRRIERYYNKDIVVGSNDDDLIYLYTNVEDVQPYTTINIYVNDPWRWNSWYGYDPYWYGYDPYWRWGYYDPYWHWGFGWRGYWGWHGWHRAWYPGYYGLGRPASSLGLGWLLPRLLPPRLSLRLLPRRTLWPL